MNSNNQTDCPTCLGTSKFGIPKGQKGTILDCPDCSGTGVIQTDTVKAKVGSKTIEFAHTAVNKDMHMFIGSEGVMSHEPRLCPECIEPGILTATGASCPPDHTGSNNGSDAQVGKTKEACNHPVHLWMGCKTTPAEQDTKELNIPKKTPEQLKASKKRALKIAKSLRETDPEFQDTKEPILGKDGELHGEKEHYCNATAETIENPYCNCDLEPQDPNNHYEHDISTSSLPFYCNDCDIPVMVLDSAMVRKYDISAWINYGKKYGYYKYVTKQAAIGELKNFTGNGSVIHDCGKRVDGVVHTQRILDRIKELKGE